MLRRAGNCDSRRYGYRHTPPQRKWREQGKYKVAPQSFEARKTPRNPRRHKPEFLWPWDMPWSPSFTCRPPPWACSRTACPIYSGVCTRVPISVADRGGSDDVRLFPPCGRSSALPSLQFDVGSLSLARAPHAPAPLGGPESSSPLQNGQFCLRGSGSAPCCVDESGRLEIGGPEPKLACDGCEGLYEGQEGPKT